jgi:hypothetical protein
MKKLIYLVLTLTLGWHTPVLGQGPTTAQVRNELAKYPTVKSSFCKACLLWRNPYYKSIADTVRHMPLITYERYTKSGADSADHATFGRTGIFAAWHSLPGQVNEGNVYKAANVIVKPSGDEIAKGHVQPWVLNRFNPWACIFSDIYTFNAACEHQGQNVGTEIATEELTRQLLKTNAVVNVWGGCFVDGNNPVSYTDGKITDIQPSHYWKIIQYGNTTLCYWMLNLKTEARAKLPGTVVTYQQLVKNLGFDPEKIFPAAR